MALVAALGSMMLCGTAEARGPAAWHQLGRIDGTRPAGLACPSRSLCVAVDVAGHVLSSTHPLAARPAWTVANVDPGTRLRALSCPSRRLCVAVDDAGRVLTARNPRRGAASWTSGTVRPGGLLDVSCPSARLCVAVGGPDVAFSRAPREGARSWRLVRGVDQSLPPECGTDGQGSACGAADLLSVSCPTASYCTASDSLGSRVRSTAPGTVAGWPRTGTTATGLVDGTLSCLDRYRCLTMCAAGSGFFTSQCPGTPTGTGDLETLSSAKIGVTHHLVSPDPLVGLWCPSATLCFAADAPGALIASRDPANLTSSWATVISAPHVPDDPRTILAVACPRQNMCLALDSTGTLHAGKPPPSFAAIRARLRAAAFAATRGRARDRSVTVHAPIAGRLTIVFHRPRQHRVLARGDATFRRAGPARLTFRLTRAGRRAVAHAGFTVVTFEAVFAAAHPAGVPAGHPVHLLARVRLRGG